MMNYTTLMILIFSFSIQNVFTADDVEFYYYNKLNSNGSKIYVGNITSLKDFQANLPIRILVHGWRGNYNYYPMTTLRDAYLTKGNINVIVVNWEKALMNDYFLVITYLKEIGAKVSALIKFLNKEINVNFSNIYIIGYSLGAHIAGLSGRNLLPNKIDTIFALDPARFLLDNYDFIKKNDAQYIEVIHTNAGVLGVGVRDKIGDSDFYPNYGKIQSHCKKSLNIILCDHNASILYLAESINSNIGFYGIECQQIQSLRRNIECQCTGDCKKFKMGGEPSLKDDKVNGTYYLETKENFPFANGK